MTAIGPPRLTPQSHSPFSAGLLLPDKTSWRLQLCESSVLLKKFCLCSFLATVNKLSHLEGLVVCNALDTDGDFGKLGSHPSLQTIKLLTTMCTCKAFTSVLRLRQLQELWIEDLKAMENEPDVASFPLSHCQLKSV